MLRLSRTYDKFQVEGGKEKGKMKEEDRPAIAMTEQNRRYVTKEIGKLLSEIWRVKGLAEQEYGQQNPITKKLASMHEDAQKLLRE